MRTLAIGDIHGCSGMLDDLLTAVELRPTDTLVFLGDYVDRGPDSRGVIDRVLALRQTHTVVNLRGNHELMMLRARSTPEEFRNWASVGGLQALGSYGPSPGRTGTLADVPPEHWKFLEDDCVNYHETATHLFAHAGFDPGSPMDHQPELDLFWEFLSAPIRHPEGKTVVVGHSSQRSGNVLDLGKTICIDTNACNGGWLTALCAETGDYWQVNPLGKVRRGFVGG